MNDQVKNWTRTGKGGLPSQNVLKGNTEWLWEKRRKKVVNFTPFLAGSRTEEENREVGNAGSSSNGEIRDNG